MARQKHPGQKNNLDALCKRYEIDNSQRSLHGALLDARILADVYLMMTGGQTALSLDESDSESSPGTRSQQPRTIARKGPLPLWVVSAESDKAHAEYLEFIRLQSALRE
jgi:DNA polymerase-3 subunit epsilon